MSVHGLTGGSRLRGERMNRGKSLREAAKEIGKPVTVDILSRAESGARPHPGAAKAIADFYELQVTDIWPVDEEVAAA